MTKVIFKKSGIEIFVPKKEYEADLKFWNGILMEIPEENWEEETG